MMRLSPFYLKTITLLPHCKVCAILLGHNLCCPLMLVFAESSEGNDHISRVADCTIEPVRTSTLHGPSLVPSALMLGGKGVMLVARLAPDRVIPCCLGVCPYSVDQRDGAPTVQALTRFRFAHKVTACASTMSDTLTSLASSLRLPR